MSILNHINEVVSLAHTRRTIAHNEFEHKVFRLADIETPKELKDTTDNLVDYLNTLDYKELAFIEALMLVGRNDADNLRDSIMYVKETFASGDKTALVEYLSSKMLLDTYLASALCATGEEKLSKHFETFDI